MHIVSKVVYPALMEMNEIIGLAQKLLTTTRPLAAGPYQTQSMFARVVEGTFRRDYLTFYTIVFLAMQTQPEAPRDLGTISMDLCRRVLEDVISLEYMLFKGKEEFAKKFLKYSAIEAKRDMDYLEAAGIPLDEEYIRNTNNQYDKVKRDFLDTSNKTKRNAWNELTTFLKSEGKLDEQMEQRITEERDRRYPQVQEPRKAWAGLEVEAMIEELVQGGVLTADNQKILKQTYIVGNRKNHFSPIDISEYLSSAFYNAADNSNLSLSLIAMTTLMTRMARIFADEFVLPESTKQAIKEIGLTLVNAHLSDRE